MYVTDFTLASVFTYFGDDLIYIQIVSLWMFTIRILSLLIIDYTEFVFTI